MFHLGTLRQTLEIFQSDDYYAKNLAVQVGARKDEVGEVTEMLKGSSKILADMAEKFLKEIRGR